MSKIAHKTKILDVRISYMTAGGSGTSCINILEMLTHSKW